MTLPPTPSSEVDAPITSVTVGQVNLPAAAEAAVMFAANAHAPSTRRAYASDWKRYATWCETAHLDPLPPDPSVLAMYFADQAARTVETITTDDGVSTSTWRPEFAPSTINRWVAALTYGFKQHGYPNPFTHPDLENLLAGIRRDLGVKRAVRRMDPLLLADVRRIMDEMDTTWPAGLATIRDRFILLVGFAGAFRRSELCAMRVADVTVDRHDGLRIVIPRAKTDQESKGALKAIPYGVHYETCGPCAAWHWWHVLAASDNKLARTVASVHFRITRGHVCRDPWPKVDPDAPVLRRIDRYGNVGQNPLRRRELAS